MVKQIIGGVIVLVIGGTSVAVNKSDVAKNFSSNTGMTQQQAQDYVNNIKPSDLQSFSKIGQSFIDDGNSVQNEDATIDCDNYTYKWESALLSCSDGKTQLQSIGVDEVALGNCYQALDTNLGDSAKSKVNECISDIDTVNADYNTPLATAVIDNNTITTETNSNSYNKSILQASLQSH